MAPPIRTDSTPSSAISVSLDAYQNLNSLRTTLDGIDPVAVMSARTAYRFCGTLIEALNS